MNRIGRSELTLGEVRTLDELVESTRSVTSDAVARVVERVLTGHSPLLAAVCPFYETAFSSRVS